MNSAAASAPSVAKQAVHTFMYPQVSQIATCAHTVLASSLAGNIRA